MLYCPKCGTKHPNSAQVCTECGSSLAARDVASGEAPQRAEEGSGTVERSEPAVAPSPTLEPRAKTYACPNCGTAASESAQFCQQCGKKLAGPDYGGFWIRLGGWVIDAIILGAVSGVLSLLVGNPGSVLGLAIGIGYYVGFNANGGTLGKRAVGLRLESDKTGEDIGYGAALVRYVAAFASALVLLLGYFWVIWDDKKQTWHDKAAGSVVVRDRAR